MFIIYNKYKNTYFLVDLLRNANFDFSTANPLHVRGSLDVFLIIDTIAIFLNLYYSCRQNFSRYAFSTSITNMVACARRTSLDTTNIQQSTTLSFTQASKQFLSNRLNKIKQILSNIDAIEIANTYIQISCNVIHAFLFVNSMFTCALHVRHSGNPGFGRFVYFGRIRRFGLFGRFWTV